MVECNRTEGTAPKKTWIEGEDDWFADEERELLYGVLSRIRYHIQSEYYGTLEIRYSSPDSFEWWVGLDRPHFFLAYSRRFRICGITYWKRKTKLVAVATGPNGVIEFRVFKKHTTSIVRMQIRKQLQYYANVPGIVERLGYEVRKKTEKET